MIAPISLLTALAFAAIYPLCFWISYDKPLKNNFHKFHIGLPNVIGGVVLVFIWFMDFPLSLKILVTLWKAIFISVSSYSWKKESPSPKLLLLPCLLGIYAFVSLQAHIIAPGWTTASIGILSAMIFCCAFYAMNLGHWYLNVHGLPMFHLTRSIYVFWILLGIRALWNAYYILFQTVMSREDIISIFQFIIRMDGFLLIIGIFFGTLFPLITLYFVKEVLKLKNTQSATGILYVILCAILIGDIAYKYYLIKFGIPM